MSSQVSPGSEAERKWTTKLRDSFTRKNSAKKTDFADDVSEVASVDVKIPPLDLVQGEKKKKSLRRRLSGSFKKMLTPRSSLSGPMRSDSLARTNSLAYDDDASTKDLMEEEVSLPSSPVQSAEVVRAPSMPLEAGAMGSPEPEPQQPAETKRADVTEAAAPAAEEPAQADDDLLEPVAEEPAAEEAATDAAPEEVVAPAPQAAAESPFSAYLAQAAGMMEVAAPEEPAAASAAAEEAVVVEESEVEVPAVAEEPAEAAAAAAAEEPAPHDEAPVEPEVEAAAVAVPEEEVEEAAVEGPAVAEEAEEEELAFSAPAPPRPVYQAEEEAAVEEPATAEEPAAGEEPTVEEEQDEAAPALFIEESTGSLTYTFHASPTAPADDAAGAAYQPDVEALAGEAEPEEEEPEEVMGQGALADEASGSYSPMPEVVERSVTPLPYPAPKAVLLFPTTSTSSTGILVPDTPQAADPAEEVSKSASSGGLAGLDSGAASDSGDKSAEEEEEPEPAPAPAVEGLPVGAAELWPVDEAATKAVVLVEEAGAKVEAEARLEESCAVDAKALEAPIAATPAAVSKGTRDTRRGRGHGLLRTLAKAALLGAAVGAVAVATGGLPSAKQAKRAERRRAGAGELAVTAALEPAERDGPLAALSQWFGAST